MSKRLPVLNNEVRLNKPINGSMSKTDLLLNCVYWASPTVALFPEPTDPKELNYPLRFGRAFHKTAEIHLASRGKKRPSFQAIADCFNVETNRLEHFFRRFKEFIDEFLKKNKWDELPRLVERKMTYDPFSNESRFLESTKERDYSNRKSTELPGTGDLALVEKDKPFVVFDWKSGTSSYDAQDNGQLLSLSSALQHLLNNDHGAVVFIVRIDDDFIEPSDGFLTKKMLDDHRESLQTVMGSALSPNPFMRPGMHCHKYYCPAMEICPAHAGPMSLRDVTDGVMTEEQRGYNFARFKTAERMLERMADFWRDNIKLNGPIYLDNGSRAVVEPAKKENLSKASIRRSLPPVEAEAMIQRLADLNAIETTEYEKVSIKPMKKVK